MKKIVFMLICCAALALQGKVFNVEIDGERVVADFWVAAEQEWQYTEEGENPNWWAGLAPHPYGCKLWYPHLSNTFNRVLNEQLDVIDALDYAGIDDWRIAQYWDIVPLKCSLFEAPLELGAKTTVTGFDPTIFFLQTSANDEGVTGGTTYYTHGRIGDENGVETGGMVDALRVDRYSDYGTPVENRQQLYMLPRAEYGVYGNKGSEVQDHYACANPETGQYFYDDALNFTSEDNPLMEQSGERVGGAWTVSDSAPVLWPADGAFYPIEISDVAYETTYNPRLGVSNALTAVSIPVSIVSVYQDEATDASADVVLEYTEAAAVVNLRAECDAAGNGRIYHIRFAGQDGVEHVLKVGVPAAAGIEPVDEGALFESNVQTANQPPAADAGGPYSAGIDEVITLDGSASMDSDGMIVRYEWDLDGDGQYNDVTGSTALFSASAAGSYTVGLRVTDDQDATDTAVVTITVTDTSGLPEVTIVASDRFAGEEGPDSGTFTISRSGGTAGDLVVQLAPGGTATEAEDYLALPRSATIADGQSSVDVLLTPVDDELTEATELVRLTLVADAAYLIGDADNALLRIEDNDELPDLSPNLLIGKPTDQSITINVIPQHTGELFFEYGTTSGVYSLQTGVLACVADQVLETVMDGLSANTEYFYRMVYRTSGGAWTNDAEYSFYTQRAADETFVFTITSDTQNKLNTTLEQAMQNILADDPDFHVDLGSTFSSDDLTTQAEVDAVYRGFRAAAYFGAIGPSIPIFLTPGNQENEEGWNFDDLPFSLALASIQARKQYYPTPTEDGFYTGNTDPLPAIEESVYGDELRENYYAFEWGNALFVVLCPFQYTQELPYSPGDVEGKDDVWTGDQWSWSLGFEQYTWLAEVLKNSRATHKLVFSHHVTGGIPGNGFVRGGAGAAPYYEWGGLNEDGTWGFSTERPGWGVTAERPEGTPIHQLFVDYGVSAYFHGHDAQYVYEELDGIVYQEVPTSCWGDAGFQGYYFETNSFTHKILPNSGHLRVTVSPADITVDYVRSDETETAYSYTIGTSGTPRADAGGPYSGGVGATINLDGSSSSDSDGTIVLYEWDFNNDGQYDDATGQTAAFSASATGTYTVGLRVTDDSGLSAADTAIVNVGGTSGLPVVSITEEDRNSRESDEDPGEVIFTRTDVLDGDLTVLFSISGSAIEGVDYQNLARSVVIPDGESSVIVDVTPIDDTLAEGTEYVTFNLVTNAAYFIGAINSATVRIYDDDDVNGAPVADSGGPYSAYVGETIALDGTASADADGMITLYEWDLDNDGQYDDATGETASISSANAGSFTIALRVTDDDGGADIDTTTVTIAEPVSGNVLLIIADDLGVDSLAAFNDDPGASLPPTPTIDSLAANGLRFNRFYAYSLCAPTRASIMTGRYAYRTGVVSPREGDHELQPNEFTLPEALVESGVISNRLACIGKWDLGSDADSPNTVGGWPHFSGGLFANLLDYYSWSKTVNGSKYTSTTYATTDNVDDGIAWIEQQGTDPWFLWLSFNAPHAPHHRPPNDLHDYDAIADTGDYDSREHFEAMVQAMDTEMGRLFTHVDWSTTTVIFMGDNGTIRQVIQPPFPDSHAKSTVYEGGFRVPVIISGAAVSSGLIGTGYEGVLHSVDLYATILELFGVQAADIVPDALELDSRSFVPVLRGENYTRVPAEISLENEYGTAVGTALVGGDYKYILKDDGTEELYNVVLDLPESNNLLDEPLGLVDQLVYEYLADELLTHINVPHCYSCSFDEESGVSIEVGWFANEGFTLWRAQNLISNDWTLVSGQELEDAGAATIMLRDPEPPADKAFYRITAP